MMMTTMNKLNELRIGNYIADYEANDGYFKVEEIKKNKQGDLAVYYRDGSFMSIEPDFIVLTEEILLKCGFKDNDYTLDLKLGSKKITFKWYSRVVSTNIRNGYYCPKYRHIKYLHQLQNLYFALTSKELEINL